MIFALIVKLVNNKSENSINMLTHGMNYSSVNSISIFISRLKICKVIIPLIYILFPLLIHGQQITNYNYNDYHGAAQNWAISQSSEGKLFIANNDGLLCYNGNDWELLESNKYLDVKAVHCVGDKVYVAGNNNIGYWETDKNGQMKYTSLLPLLKKSNINTDETFWTIASQKERIYFHSFGSILCYDGKNIELIVRDFISLFYNDNDHIYTQHGSNGLFELKDKKELLISKAPLFHDRSVKFICTIADGNLILGCSNGEIYTMINGNPVFFTRILNETGQPVMIDCGRRWKDDNRYLAIGTVSDGLYLLDIQQQKNIHLPSSRFQDLNIHNICYTAADDLWVTLDNGISRIQFNPIIELWRTNVQIGGFYDVTYFNDKRYIAAGHGLFENGKRMDTSVAPLQFCNLKGELLCGTITELLKLGSNETVFQSFRKIDGANQFEYVAEMGQEYLFVNSYSGIAILKWQNSTWTFLSNVPDSETYSYIIPENTTNIWGVQPDKGLFRIRQTANFSKIEKKENYKEIDGVKDINRIIPFKCDSQTLFATPKGIYVFDAVTKSFLRHERFSRQIQHLNELRTITSAGPSHIWVVTNDELYLYHIGDQNAQLMNYLPFCRQRLMFKNGRINIRTLGDTTYIPTFEGTVILNNKMLQSVQSKHSDIILESIRYTDSKGNIKYVDANHEEKLLPHASTNIKVQVSINIQPYPVLFSFRMAGIQKEWSSWQSSGIFYFSNLPSGNYQLEIRDSRGNILHIPLCVEVSPWLTIPMIIFYVFMLTLIVIVIVYYISGRKSAALRHKYEEERLQHAEELQRQENLQLQEKIVNQENTLKMQTRFLIQKQELLNVISTEIESQRQELGDRYPKKLYQRLKKIIQEGSTEKDKFLSLENYFVDIHYEFMNRLQQNYPLLSASELRFCCLIRANLTTKEIAAICGIEARSVEIKKYRLKRKIGLEGNSNITSYILSL